MWKIYTLLLLHQNILIGHKESDIDVFRQRESDNNEFSQRESDNHRNRQLQRRLALVRMAATQPIHSLLLSAMTSELMANKIRERSLALQNASI